MHRNHQCPMDRRSINDLSEDIKKRIADVLDKGEQLPIWRLLIKDVIRQYMPSYNEAFVTKHFAMETLLPGGSPTLKLLNDLGEKKITVGVLINWIRSLNQMRPTLQLQAVLNLLSMFADLIILFGEQGWRSGESICLSPMCLGFDSWTRHHMSAEFVGSLLCSMRFFSGNSGFPLSSISLRN